MPPRDRGPAQPIAALPARPAPRSGTVEGMRWLWIAILLGACRPARSVPTTRAPVTQRALPPSRTGPATHVVTLAPGSPTPILRGPFEVTAINPGDGLELGISTSEACEGAAWFAYSGGGAAVGEGEILCARSSRGAPVTHGFSGR